MEEASFDSKEEILKLRAELADLKQRFNVLLQVVDSIDTDIEELKQPRS